MSGYVDLYDLKRAQAETGLTSEAKRTMIDILFDGKTRGDEDISLNCFMKMNHLKSEAINLLMQDCNDKVIREDLVDRVRGMRSGIGNAVVLRRMIKMSNAIAASTRRKTAVALLIGSEENAKLTDGFSIVEGPRELLKEVFGDHEAEVAEKKAKGKKNQQEKADKKQAKRDKRQAEKKPKSNKKQDNKGNKKKKKN